MEQTRTRNTFFMGKTSFISQRRFVLRHKCTEIACFAFCLFFDSNYSRYWHQNSSTATTTGLDRAKVGTLYRVPSCQAWQQLDRQLRPREEMFCFSKVWFQSQRHDLKFVVGFETGRFHLDVCGGQADQWLELVLQHVWRIENSWLLKLNESHKITGICRDQTLCPVFYTVNAWCLLHHQPALVSLPIV